MILLHYMPRLGWSSEALTTTYSDFRVVPGPPGSLNRSTPVLDILKKRKENISIKLSVSNELFLIFEYFFRGFDTAHAAARAYDRPAIKFRGIEADINFSVGDYKDDIKQMRNFTKEEFVHILRRQSTGYMIFKMVQ
ncbi:hypothetical protein DVH24_039196 [Malus domestica]|uniref:AP2/ERF domain-containing protein n=1 Tax=Malus domestica TaxID=3750 RepID=A0A498KH82_MALDO|nr:hypothetical protein DVH24_039196 [Malus domestica]